MDLGEASASDSASTWREKLDRFSLLETGWNGYAAPPPGEAAISSAKAFLELLSMSSEWSRFSRLAPSSVGGIGVTCRDAEDRTRRAYVEFLDSGVVLALFSDGESEPRTERVHVGQSGFGQLIREIRRYFDAS